MPELSFIDCTHFSKFSEMKQGLSKNVLFFERNVKIVFAILHNRILSCLCNTADQLDTTYGSSSSETALAPAGLLWEKPAGAYEQAENRQDHATVILTVLLTGMTPSSRVKVTL